jgi:hypothetical protein
MITTCCDLEKWRVWRRCTAAANERFNVRNGPFMSIDTKGGKLSSAAFAIFQFAP